MPIEGLGVRSGASPFATTTPESADEASVSSSAAADTSTTASISTSARQHLLGAMPSRVGQSIKNTTTNFTAAFKPAPAPAPGPAPAPEKWQKPDVANWGESVAQPVKLADLPAWRAPLLAAKEGSPARKIGEQLQQLHQELTTGKIDQDSFKEKITTLMSDIDDANEVVSDDQSNDMTSMQYHVASVDAGKLYALSSEIYKPAITPKSVAPSSINQQPIARVSESSDAVASTSLQMTAIHANAMHTNDISAFLEDKVSNSSSDDTEKAAAQKAAQARIDNIHAAEKKAIQAKHQFDQMFASTHEAIEF